MLQPTVSDRRTMVEAFTTADIHTIVCRPNKSLSWRQAKWFLAIITSWSMCIGVGFLLVGAWPVLPFLGLEIVCLAVALYYVQWKLSHQEVITIGTEEIGLEYGQHWPKITYRWPRQDVRFRFEDADTTYLPPTVTLLHNAHEVRVGKNLNEEDLKNLVALLKAARVQVRSSQKIIERI